MTLAVHRSTLQRLASERAAIRATLPDLVRDPAWDMLLDLAHSEVEKHRISATALAVGAALPYPTAQRWMRELAAQGLCAFTPDREDRRRIFVGLTPKGRGVMESALVRLAVPAGRA